MSFEFNKKIITRSSSGFSSVHLIGSCKNIDRNRNYFDIIVSKLASEPDISNDEGTFYIKANGFYWLIEVALSHNPEIIEKMFNEAHPNQKRFLFRNAPPINFKYHLIRMPPVVYAAVIGSIVAVL